LRIGLFGLFGAGNSGNDGSLEAMLLFLRQAQPQAELVCICPNPARINQSLGVRAIPVEASQSSPPRSRFLGAILPRLSRKFHNFARAIMVCRTFTHVIVPGTGILDDFGASPFGDPLTLLMWCLAAKLTKTRVYFVSVGAGPVHSRLSRIFMRSAVQVADYRSYRDINSKEFMTEIGLNAEHDPVFPDLAFNLPAPDTTFKSREEEPLAVGLGIMTYHGWRNNPVKGAETYRNYITKMTKFIEWLLDQGYRVRILMGDAGDQKAVDDLIADLTSKCEGHPLERITANTIKNLHELMVEIAATDIVVATRFHNVVCALKLCRPTISISYAPKNDELLAAMGLGRYSQFIERLDVEKLIEQFKALLNEQQQHRASLTLFNDGYRDRLRAQNMMILSQLTNVRLKISDRPIKEDGGTQSFNLVASGDDR
jgi:polysaccharide pyruvyl transferase WcaK-like protein